MIVRASVASISAPRVHQATIQARAMAFSSLHMRLCWLRPCSSPEEPTAGHLQGTHAVFRCCTPVVSGSLCTA